MEDLLDADAVRRGMVEESAVSLNSDEVEKLTTVS